LSQVLQTKVGSAAITDYCFGLHGLAALRDASLYAHALAGRVAPATPPSDTCRSDIFCGARRPRAPD